MQKTFPRASMQYKIRSIWHNKKIIDFYSLDHKFVTVYIILGIDHSVKFFYHALYDKNFLIFDIYFIYSSCTQAQV